MGETPQVSGDIVGQARMARYLDDCGNDVDKAGRLFTWNLAMSGAAYEAVHLFEIILRNAMDAQLRRWNDSNGYGQAWLQNPDPRLNKLLMQSRLNEARSRATAVAARAGRAVLHDDVLAQMTLGTWRYLLPSNSSVGKQRLWASCLANAFPEWRGTAWEPIVRRVEIVHEMRNRIAHLEPLHRGDLRRARQSMRHVTSATGWEAGRIFADNERMLPLIEALPRILAGDGNAAQ